MQSMTEQVSIPPEGIDSFTSIGVHHFHAAEWEYTYNADQLDLLEEEIIDRGGYGETGVHEVYTLIEGPKLFAARIPTQFDDSGEAEEWDLRLFAGEEAARAAIAKALASRVTPSS